MTTHPYIPLYVDDFEAATAHLSPAEDGIYNRLMRLCWRTPGCSLPDDIERLSYEIGAEPPAVWALLNEFFVRSGRRWKSLAIDRWIERHDTPERRARRGVRPALRAAVLARDGERCRYCGSPNGPWHIDHIIPVCRGGSDAVSNLVVACEPCNLSKGSKLVSEWVGR